jgi:hypothetical protein
MWKMHVAVVLLLVVAACTNKDSPSILPKQTVLTWEGFSITEGDGEKAIYIVDGRRVGKGKVGFEEVLRQLRELPLGSELRIIDPNEAKNSGPRSIPPFDQYEDELDDVIKKRQLDVGHGLFSE